MDKRKHKEIRMMAIVAVITTVLSITAGAALALGEVGSEFEVFDGGRIIYGPGDGGYSNSKKTDLEDGLGERYSYCIQPEKDTPVVNRVRIAKVIEREDGIGEWGALRRILYFSPSYPGYDDNTGGITGAYYTGNFSEDWGIAHLAMSYVFKGRPSDMDTYRFTKASDLGYIWTKAKKLGEDMMKEGTAWDEAVPDNFRVFVSGTEGYQSMAVGSLEVPGTLVIKKACTMEEITSGNDSYNLKGAEYEIRNERSETVKVIALDKNGESGPVSLKPGNYSLVESKAPEGYAEDNAVHDVIVVSGSVSQVDVSDTPITSMPEIILRKRQEGSGADHGEGDGTLKGAVYCFEYHGRGNNDEKEPLRSWYFETDENGLISGRNPMFSDGFKSDPLYRNKEGEVIFPLGIYTAREVKPSEGYLTDENVCIMTIAEDGTDNVYTAEVTPAESFEKIIRGGVRISKTDAQTGGKVPQGDGRLDGAEFAVVNRSDSAVTIGGRNVDPGEKVMTIVTGENGTGETADNALPYGTYSVKEEKAPEGYLLNEKWEQTFSIRDDKKIEDLSEKSAEDTAIRSGIMIRKLDGELMKSEAVGGASLEGIKVMIRNRSANSVLVRTSFEDSSTEVEWNDKKETDRLLKEGLLKMVAPGEDIGEITLSWNEKKKAYTAGTSGKDLPYGTYGIRETVTNGTYQRTDRAEHIIELRADGSVYSYDNGHEDILSFTDRVYRSDVKGTKIKDATSERMAFIPFSIRSLTNGETHVIVTDRNGYFFTGDRRTTDELEENEKFETERKVNPFDDLLGRKDITTEEIRERKNDIRHGVWFGTGEYGSLTTPEDRAGALPFDTYILEELSCENNKGCSLQRFMFTVDEKSLSGTVDLATITDDVPEIGTYAESSGRKKEAKVSSKVSLTDEIEYRDLMPGKTYLAKGRLMDRKTGSPIKDKNGKEVQAQTEFKAEKPDGKVRVKFEFEPGDIYGKDTVVFEKIYDEDLHLIAAHEDPEDEGQTVSWEQKTEDKKKNIPVTGDITGIFNWIAAFIIGAAALAYLKIREKKTRL